MVYILGTAQIHVFLLRFFFRNLKAHGKKKGYTYNVDAFLLKTKTVIVQIYRFRIKQTVESWFAIGFQRFHKTIGVVFDGDVRETCHAGKTFQIK